MSIFTLSTDMKPAGDQPDAITKLTKGILKGHNEQVLLGITGSGKTFTMAKVIENIEKPALIIAPNKTLAAQLYSEFKTLFPQNAVEYFVSYYDYYQPEAYLPVTNTYIEKDSSINEEIDKLRHSATRSLLDRRDVIIVASVSCIYGLGTPEAYQEMMLFFETGIQRNRDDVIAKLVEMQYERNDTDFHRGVFRVRGDRIDIFPAYEEEKGIRIEFFGDIVDGIHEIDPLRGVSLKELKKAFIYPGSHYVTEKSILKRAVIAIQKEMEEQVAWFKSRDKLIEAQRIFERTMYDIEMINEMGYCSGIENYSRHLTNRKQGEPPPTLLEYFNRDFVIFIDESHISVPQLNAMYRGDRARKMTLVEFGFRLPSALDNRPLKFEEFEKILNKTIYVSATPGNYELDKCRGHIIEQIIRPTGLMDPSIEVRPATHQVDELLDAINKRVKKRERVLVTTLTKRMAEELTDYYSEIGIRARYLHSDITTLERVKILRELRLGKFDVLIGINLLREGLDLPEVSLVAILDADKEGFLRSGRSLIQTCGRAARNLNGHVIMFADKITGAMDTTIKETNRRRKIQKAFNEKNNITPVAIKKAVYDEIASVSQKDYMDSAIAETRGIYFNKKEDIEKAILKLKKKMKQKADDLFFEDAMKYRDKIKKLEKTLLIMA